MKTHLYFLLFTLFVSFTVAAQDPINVEVSIDENDLVAPEVIDSVDNEIAPDSLQANEGEKRDTINVRIGKHNIEVITNDKKTQIDVEEIEDYNSRWETHKWDEDKIETPKIKNRRKFNGHWGGLDFGVNLLYDNGKNAYANYPETTPNFMDIRPEKSFEFNFNFAEYSFGFGSYIGIVTGLGLNFNDYKFRNKYTLQADDGMIQPVALPEENFRLSKLSTSYLTAPLMLEIQIPGNGGQDRMFLAGGIIGGLKMGEHTKTKIGDNKNKDKGDHYIAPIRWGYTARVGFENIGISATYYVTELFEKGKGPVFQPLTIGITSTF